MSCKICTDEQGEVLVPYYGVAPHTCFHQIPGAVIGESVVLPPEQWPANFIQDPESPGHGIWWCEACGEGREQAQKSVKLAGPLSDCGSNER